VNPKEVGLGMSIASIDTIFTQGNLQSTSVNTDVAIQGNGFFILQNGDSSFYTRAGSFGLDRDGTLVNPANGFRVQGWMARDLNGQQIIQTAADTEDIIIPIGSKDPARATTTVNFKCNLDKTTPEILADATAADIARGRWATEFRVYDSYGREHNLSVSFEKNVVDGAAVPNQWLATVNVDPGAAEDTATDVGLVPGTGTNTFVVTFDNSGTLLSVADPAGNVSAAEGEVELAVGFNVPESTPGDDGAAYRQVFNVNLGTIGSQLNTITQSAAKSSTKAFSQDGYTMGFLNSFKIDSSGSITGVYSNGTNRLLGQIALASFTNQGGLEKAGDNTYVESNNSGTAEIGESGVAGKGSLLAGSLEMSNVDLTEQFTDMIVTQRGFQASSKTIQTADTLLDTVLSLKR
jgi:flagellar hook protein FlgE